MFGTWRRHRFFTCPEVCGHFDFNLVNARWNSEPSLDGESHINWSDKHTTPDQLRIEQALERAVSPSSTMLHVGVGNSQLATRWHERVNQIIGITIAADEIEKGLALGLSN